MKRGISTMVAYIVLVGMAIGISSFVFVWLTYYLPNDDGLEVTACPEGATVLIKSVYCSAEDTELEVVIKNNGRFSLDGYKVSVNDKRGAGIGAYEIENMGEAILPKKESTFFYDYSEHVSGGAGVTEYFESSLTLVEISPFVIENGEPKYCGRITESLECNLRDEICFDGDDDDRDGFVDCDDPDCFYNFYCASADDSIIGRYIFEGSDPNRDYSLYHNDAQNFDVMYIDSSECYSGGCYDFVSDQGAVELLNHTDASKMGGSFSVSLMIKPIFDSGLGKKDARIISRDAKKFWAINIDQKESQTSKIKVNVQKSGSEGGHGGEDDDEGQQIDRDLDYGQWYNIVAVWDNSSNKNFTFYIDGEPVYTEVYNGKFDSSERAIGLGSKVKEHDNGRNTCLKPNSKNFVGYMDEVIVYNRSLSEEEVKLIANYFS